jgi:hypothetical protein
LLTLRSVREEEKLLDAISPVLVLHIPEWYMAVTDVYA